MSEWNAEQYLKFKNQRTQPAVDLAKSVMEYKPNSILDVGCGPGNSTSVLNNIFVNARILGVDNSETMIQKASQTYPHIDFKLCDVTSELDNLDNYDVIFSNACLQWIPDHKKFIPKLMNKLNSGGALAVQIPMNGQETLFRIMNEVVQDSKWDFPNPILKRMKPCSLRNILIYLLHAQAALTYGKQCIIIICQMFRRWSNG